jgi:hypothetical protein
MSEKRFTATLRRKNRMKEWIFGFIIISLVVADVFTAWLVKADPRGQSCECRELSRIRLLLEHQFGVVCDERHCEGSSSSGQGGSLP